MALTAKTGGPITVGSYVYDERHVTPNKKVGEVVGYMNGKVVVRLFANFTGKMNECILIAPSRMSHFRDLSNKHSPLGLIVKFPQER